MFVESINPDPSSTSCSFSIIQFSISSASLENCCRVWDSPSFDLFSIRASFSCSQRLRTSFFLLSMSSLW